MTGVEQLHGTILINFGEGVKRSSRVMFFGRFAFIKCINDPARRLMVLSLNNNGEESSPDVSSVSHLSE